MKNAIGPISILGDLEPGKTLIIRGNAAKDPEGINRSTIVYQWYQDDKLISSGQKLIVTNDMQGSVFKAVMRFEDLQGNPEELFAEKKVPYSEPRLKTLNVLYTYLLKRDPDDSGLKFWAGFLEKLEEENDPLALAKVIHAFMSSDSYKKEFNK